MRAILLLFLLPSAWSAAHDPLVVVATDAVAIEAESVAIGSGWVLERDIAGFTGDGYLRWAAPDAYATPGTGELQYRLLLAEGGRFHVRLRLNTAGAERSDLGNDVFSRVDDGTWVKTFVGGGSPDGWATRTRLEPQHGKFAEAVYDLTPGLHTIGISGRSHGLRFDRLVIWRDGGKQPDDHLPASSGVPVIPESLTDPAVREAWRLGGLGAVSAWAGKRAKDPAAIAATAALTAHADQRLGELSAWRAKDPLGAVDQLDNLTAQYQGSARGRDLAKLLREWSDEPTVKAERKARTMGDAITRLLADYQHESDATRKAAMAAALGDALTTLRRAAAGTQTLTLMEQRLAEAGIR